jgi:hypothetical protein
MTFDVQKKKKQIPSIHISHLLQSKILKLKIHISHLLQSKILKLKIHFNILSEGCLILRCQRVPSSSSIFAKKLHVSSFK